MDIELSIQGESVLLLPEKMCFLASSKTLLVADTHFGKSATFRKAGIPVPPGTTASMLAELSNAVNRLDAKRLIILGDFVHSRTRASIDFEDELMEWRERTRKLQIVLVRGNHDRHQDELFHALKLVVVGEPFREPPFAFCHFPNVACESADYVFSGHAHPAVRFEEFGRTWTRLPCFAIGNQRAILPSFGKFTGTSLIDPEAFERIFVCGEGQLAELTYVDGEGSGRAN